jgi:hypothetical protein
MPRQAALADQTMRGQAGSIAFTRMIGTEQAKHLR